MQNTYRWSPGSVRRFVLIMLTLTIGLAAWYGASTTSANDRGISVKGSSSSTSAVSPTSTAPNEDLPEGGEHPNADYRELAGFNIYVDPGHGGFNPPGEPCQDFGATGPNGTFEKDWVLQIAYTLGASSFGRTLERHGANVYYTRTTDVMKCARQRWEENNLAYANGNRGTESNWRYISIHLNGNINEQNTNKTEIYRYLQYHQHALDLSDIAKEWVGREVLAPSQNRLSLTKNLWAVRETLPQHYNILTESNYLAYNVAFENRLRFEAGFLDKLVNAHYRSLVDFWLVGYQRPHQTPHPEIIKEYNNSIAAGKDPGVPFANGPEYYVHQWGYAWTQEFIASNGTKGSILECRNCTTPLPTPQSAATPRANYVRNPIWAEYIDKGGPTTNGSTTHGPGMPYGPSGFEHIWPNAARGVRGISFYYPQVQNFERGAITYHDVEGPVFLPNCQANGVYNTWATLYAERIVRRFAISNDRPGPSPTRVGSSPTPTPLLPYTDSGLHGDDPATRAQLAQTLMFAEGYPRYSGSNLFVDIANHWGKQWINNAASRGIIGGYADGTFRPDNSATRGQFTKMLVGARGWPTPTPTTQTFEDVLPTNDFYKYIEPAVSRGIIGGYPCGGPNEPCFPPLNRPYFRPNADVTRAQMMKMVDIAVTCPYTPCGEPIGCWR